MGDLLRTNYRGATVTLAVTGLPILITGTVVETTTTAATTADDISLKLKDGKIIHITEDLIAFFF